MSTVLIKEEAHKMVEQMPPDSTWEDLRRKIYEHESIMRGLKDCEEGRTKDQSEIMKKYGLSA